MIGRSFTARACANIALVKYWGKRDGVRNLPAAGSLSLTLDALTTVTTVRFDPALAADAMTLDGAAASAKVLARTTTWLDRVRELAGVDARAAIDSVNHFPTASGLASSASGFAALALAATRAAGLDLDGAALSRLARLGSGSAARVAASASAAKPEADDARPDAVGKKLAVLITARVVMPASART